MIGQRVKEWLAEHPKVLQFAFLVLFALSGDDLTSGGGGSAYIGP